MIHRRKHPNLDVEGCFGCKIASTTFGANTTTTGGSRVKQIAATEKRWAVDMAAYKRLRNDGLHPEQIDGCAVLESEAKNEWQVENLRQDPIAYRSQD